MVLFLRVAAFDVLRLPIILGVVKSATSIANATIYPLVLQTVSQ